MSAVSKSYTFVPGTDIESAESNQNFDDIINYVNGEVIVRDASKAFTAIPTGPGVDPTSDNQFARKKYVDDKDAAVSSTVTSNKSDADGKFLVRPTISGDNNQIVKAAEILVALDGNGEGTVVFPAAFPNSLITVMVSNSDVGSNGSGANGMYGSATVGVLHTGKSKTGFKIRVYDRNTAFGINVAHINVSVRLAYIAVGT